jgi:hypothetical protein
MPFSSELVEESQKITALGVSKGCQPTISGVLNADPGYRGAQPQEKRAATTDSRLESARHVVVRLGVTFGVLIAMLFGTGYLAAHWMQRTKAGLQADIKEALLKLQLSQEALRYSSENSRITMQLFLVHQKEVLDQLVRRRGENSGRISAIILELESHGQSQRESGLLEAVKESRSSYVGSYQRALDLLLVKKKNDAAAGLMVQECTPALLRYHAAWDEFSSFQLEQISVRSAEEYAASRRMVLALIVFGGALAGTIAMVTTRKVALLMRSRVRVQEQLYKLNAELEQRVAGRTTELVRTEAQLRESLMELRVYKAISRPPISLWNCCSRVSPRTRPTGKPRASWSTFSPPEHF